MGTMAGAAPPTIRQACPPSSCVTQQDAASSALPRFCSQGRIHMPADSQHLRRPWNSCSISCKGVSNGKPGRGRGEQQAGPTGNGDIYSSRRPGGVGGWSPHLSDLSSARSEEAGSYAGSSGGKLSKSEQRFGKENEGEDPYRELEGGGKVYLDELDILDLLDPHPYLRPMKRSTYNHAAFIWKKIGDIPEERRHRLIKILQPKHIDKMWALAGLRYEDDNIAAEDPFSMFATMDRGKPVYWDGQVNGVPWAVGWCSRFQKVFFKGQDGRLYGRTIAGGPLLKQAVSRVAPLYFEVKRASNVKATDEPCDLAFDYGSGQLHLQGTLPQGFPAPAKHLGPFGDAYFDYVRAVGPGVVVGQVWQEGLDPEQPPQPRLGNFALVKRYSNAEPEGSKTR